MKWIYILTLLPVTAFLAARLTKASIYLAEKSRILDVPNERSLHSGAKPRTGGLVFCAIMLLMAIVDRFLDQENDLQLAYFIAALFVAAISFYDDCKGLPTSLRLVIHIGCALMVAASLPLPLMVTDNIIISSRLILYPLIAFWIVGLTNAYNFMDGCDGIAGTQALMAGLGWVLLAYIAGLSGMVALLGVLLGGAALGFLFYNWQPSRIFMGDVGSAFLGFTFASMPLLIKPTQGYLYTIGAGACLVWPFIADASFTFVRRLLNGENVFKAHRSHLYQRLVLAGWSHASVSLIYGGLALVGWPLAIGWHSAQLKLMLLCPVIITLLSFALWRFVCSQEEKRK